MYLLGNMYHSESPKFVQESKCLICLQLNHLSSNSKILPSVYFLYVENWLPAVKIFAAASVKDFKWAWNNTDTYTWKTLTALQNFEKISYVKSDFYTWKKNKTRMRENEEVPTKNLEKIFKCTFLCKRFSFFYFLFPYIAFFILLIQNSVHGIQMLYVKNVHFLFVKTQG